MIQMPNLYSLKRQHNDILKAIDQIESKVNRKSIESNAKSIAKGINELSGKLKIHLSHEDRYLYPNFKKSKNLDLKNKANQYIQEMGDLSGVYNDFKSRFNTPTKILKKQENLIKESKLVFKAVKKRIHQEDTDLYKLAENL